MGFYTSSDLRVGVQLQSSHCGLNIVRNFGHDGLDVSINSRTSHGSGDLASTHLLLQALDLIIFPSGGAMPATNFALSAVSSYSGSMTVAQGSAAARSNICAQRSVAASFSFTIVKHYGHLSDCHLAPMFSIGSLTPSHPASGQSGSRDDCFQDYPIGNLATGFGSQRDFP